MADVFISYSRKDSEFVRALAEGLVARGKDVWVDWEDIPATADWFDEIGRGIDGADGFLYVISPDSVSSEVCARELAHAEQAGKRVIPVLRRRVPDADVPPRVSAHNWIDASDDDGAGPVLDALIAALDTDLEHVRGHTRWLGEARDWERSERDGSLLLRGTELAEAEAWAGRAVGKQPEETPLQAEYISASRQAATSRQRRLVGAVSVALVVSVALTIFALISRHTAVENEKTAQSRALLAQAQNQHDRDPELSLLLARRAYDIKPAAPALDEIRESLLRSYVRLRFVEDYRVSAALPSPDGRLALIATEDGAVRVRDLETGREVSRVAESGTRSGNVTWAPDSKRYATGGPEGDVRVFDARSGEPVQQAKVEGATLQIAWSPAGSRIAVSSATDLAPESAARGLDSGHGAVHVLDAAGAALRSRFRIGSGKIVPSIAWSPDGRRIAGAAADGDTEVHDAASGRRLFRLPQGRGAVTPSVAWARDADVIATATICPGCKDPASEIGVRAWNGSTGKLLAAVPSSLTGAVAINATGSYLAFVSSGGVGQVYTIEQRRTLSPLVAVFSQSPAAVAIDENGLRVAIAERDGSIHVFDATTGEEVASLLGHRERVTSLAFLRSNLGLLSGADDATARSWAIDLPESVFDVENAGGLSDGQPAVSPDGRLAIFPETDGGAAVRRVPSGNLAARLPDALGLVAGAAWDRTGRWLFTVSGQGTSLQEVSLTDARVFDGRTLREVTRLETSVPISSATFADDEARIITGHVDGTVRVFGPSEAKPLHVLDDKRGDTVFTVAGAAGLVLANGKGRTAALWRADDGRPLHVLEGHAEPLDRGFVRDLGVRSSAIARDGARVATGGVDGTVRTWNAETGKQEQLIAGHRGQVTSVAFSPDGELLASGSSDGNVKLWRAATGDRVATLPAVLPSVAGLPITTVGVGWSADGRTVLSSGGLRARFWDAGTRRLLLDVFAGSAGIGARGRMVAVLAGGRESVYSCAVCTDADGLLALAKRRSTRELTPEERRQYLGG